MSESDFALAGIDNELPFDQAKQKGLMGHLLQNEVLFLESVHIIEPHWWSNPYLVLVWRAAVDFFTRHKRPGTLEEVKFSSNIADLPPDKQSRCLSIISEAVHQSSRFGLEVMGKQLTEWCRSVYTKKMIEEAAQEWNKLATQKQSVAPVIERVRDGIQQIDRVLMEGVGTNRFTNWKSIIAQRKEELDDVLTWGVPELDQCLNRATKDGGLVRGDLTLLLAPTNIGKTTTCISVARANILRGKKVLFVTHEGNDNNIFDKLLCAMLGKTPGWLLNWHMHEGAEEQINRAVHLLETHMRWIHIPDRSIYAEQIVERIKRESDKFISETGGEHFDLLIDDYPAKLSSIKASKGYLERRHELEIVYDLFRSLAEEYKWHSLCPIQANRAAAKILEGRGDSKKGRFLESDDVADAWGPVTLATNVISINRDSQMRADEVVVFRIGKSRSGETGWNIACNSDFGRCLTHSPELGAAIYRSEDPMSEKVKYFLMAHKGEVVPASSLRMKVEEWTSIMQKKI